MIGLYCRRRHRPGDSFCPACRALLSYALDRLAHCPFKDDKPVCSHCPRHCYRAREREAIRAVMRYAGPRLLWVHPVLSLRHGIDHLGSLRFFREKTPARPREMKK